MEDYAQVRGPIDSFIPSRRHSDKEEVPGSSPGTPTQQRTRPEATSGTQSLTRIIGFREDDRAAPAADFGGPNRYQPPGSSDSERSIRTVPELDSNIPAPQGGQLRPCNCRKRWEHGDPAAPETIGITRGVPPL